VRRRTGCVAGGCASGDARAVSQPTERGSERRGLGPLVGRVVSSSSKVRGMQNDDEVTDCHPPQNRNQFVNMGSYGTLAW